MTQKEKAEELFNKYYDALSDNDIYIGITKNSKQCALIAVDEIVSILGGIRNGEEWQYWLNVKEEINKL